MFVSGLELQVDKLYPAIKYPVSNGTPMISPLMRWNHSKDWYVPFDIHHFESDGIERLCEIHLKPGSYEYVTGHVIDGKENLILF